MSLGGDYVTIPTDYTIPYSHPLNSPNCDRWSTSIFWGRSCCFQTSLTSLGRPFRKLKRDEFKSVQFQFCGIGTWHVVAGHWQRAQDSTINNLQIYIHNNPNIGVQQHANYLNQNKPRDYYFRASLGILLKNLTSDW